MTGLSVLILDRTPPRNPRQGNELIAMRVMPWLRSHRRVLVAPFVAAGQERADVEAELHDLFDEVHLVPRHGRVTGLVGGLEPALARTVGTLPGGRGRRVGPLDLDFPARFERAILAVLEHEAPDVIHVRQLPMAAYWPVLRGRPRLLELVDSEELGSRRTRNASTRNALRWSVARELERRAVGHFPIVTTVAEADAAAIRRIAPSARVEVVPNGVDSTAFDPDAVRAAMPVDCASQPEPGLVAFVGAMSFPPNVAAATWFATEVLPRLRALRPGVRFAIVGRDPTAAVSALAADPSIEVTGSVDDVRPWLLRASVVVVPMVSGSGIKNKLLEALAMARPVVATPLASEGMALVAGRDLLLARDPEAFAASVTELLDDPARGQAMGRAGRAAIEAAYTWPAAAARYESLWSELATTKRR